MRLFSIWAVVLAVFVIVTSALGGYRYFSPIPYWDQWDSYIGFYERLQQGPFAAFWGWHTQHRIVFSKLLFLLDIELFGGWNIFTVVMNYVLLLGVGLVIWHEYRLGRVKDGALSNQQSPWLIVGLIFGFLFAWCQFENLKSGFQSPFIAVYLFALLAFAAYSRPEHPFRRVALAILFSWLATISMGNGIATFVVLIGQGILLRRPWKEAAAFAVVGIVTAIIYFQGYHNHLPHPPVSSLERALALLWYVVIFLGNPFYFAADFPVPSTSLSAAAGLCYLLVASQVIGVLFFRRQITPWRAFLAAIIAMVVAAAAGAASGRWMLGLPSAMASRYTTPTLMGYLALSLLVLDIATSRWARFNAMLVPLIALTAVAGFQMQASGDTGYLYDGKLAVLGQKTGLDHPIYDAAVYPAGEHDNFVAKANFAAAKNIGPYGGGWLHDAGVVKFDSAQVDTKLCEGFLDTQTEDDVGLVVSGWAVMLPFKQASLLIVLVDADGQTAGYGVTGGSRPDVVAAYKGAPGDSGWIGFAKRTGQSLRAYAYVSDKFCPLASVSH